jgi:iron complex outermembrane recepter protein
MRPRNLVLAALAIILATATSSAQTEGDDDSVRTYRLGDVTVRADSMRRVSAATVQQLPASRIERTDAATAAGVIYQIPAARIQTNSRGEALVYMRASAERQVALFFDGALMNVPWDNRLDMSLLPTGAIGGIAVSKGAPSVLYGANTLGGTINMVSVDRDAQGSSTQLESQAGSNGLIGGSLLHIGRAGDFRYVGEIGYSSREGFSVPAGADLGFHQTDERLRTNSDIRSFNLYLRGEHQFSEGSELGAAVHFTDAEKGVAPEGHIEGARFWRYPTWRGLTISLNSEAMFGEESEWSVRGAAWGTTFAQDIAQYEDARYEAISAREEDRDLTFGTRVIVGRTLGDGRIALAINGLASTHDQRDLQFDSTGTLIELRDSTGTVVPYPTATYQQQIYSTGIEADQRFGPATISLGASFDGMRTPLTGDKPSQEPFGDYSVVGGLNVEVDDARSVRVSAGRKTRFPTMRELYGEALRRFLINPNLKPEETWVGEIGAETRGDAGALSVVGFLYSTRNTIDQRTIDTLGGRKRQRINLPGSRSLGVEIVGALRAFVPFRLEGHFTYVDARGESNGADGSDSTFTLTEKPEIISTVTAEYLFGFGLLPSIEIVHTGLAFSPDDDGDLVRLEPSTVLNARLAYRFAPWDAAFVQVYARVNNLTDALVQPQLGLPGAGRELVAGFNLAF